MISGLTVRNRIIIPLYIRTHRFVGVCDAGGAGDHIGHLCSEDFTPRGQCEWLEGELNQGEKQKFIFAHIPPHPDGRDENMYMSRNDSRYFNEAYPENAAHGDVFWTFCTCRRTGTISAGHQNFGVRSCAWNFREAPLGFLHVGVKDSGIVTREIITG